MTMDAGRALACAALALCLSCSSQGGAAMHLLARYDAGGRGVSLGAEPVRIAIALDGRDCAGGGRVTLYLRGLHADGGSSGGYRVLLMPDGGDGAGTPVGTINFYGIGPGIARDVSFELAWTPPPIRNGRCAVHLSLQPAGPPEAGGGAAIDSVELWGQ
ncbi:hypothetical protein [Chromobacterium sp. CV08]|uniref:hypothetical protein n=1 Tax=Chromobacterium sp. CV08 TaxID=3133274 RepID=UPI003DA8AF14